MANQKPAEELSFGSWERPKIAGTLPLPRFGHASVVLGSRMYMWGGGSNKEDGSTLWYNDMYTLHFGDVLKWETVAQEGDIPSPREGHTLNVIEDDLYLYGGVDKEDTFTCAEGLYVFKTGPRTWFKRETTGTPPKAQNVSAVVSEQRLFTFGGILDGVAQNTVHILDTASLDWALAQTTGTLPPPRCDHACAVVGHKMYLTGGSGSNDLFYNDVHVLNLGSLEWVCVEMKGIPPKPRDYTTLTALSNWYLILFAGSSQADGSDVAFADLHYIDLTSKSLTWSPVAFKKDALPDPRYGHTTVLYQQKLYAFGGQNTEQELNDTWTVEAKVPAAGFDPTPVPRVRYNTSTPIPAPRKPLIPAPPKPVKPRDFEELRMTYVKRINEMFDTLSEKFLQLDTLTETLAGERAAFEAEKKDHYELYERQQKELKEMLDSHRQQNEEWTEKMRVENNQERRALAEEKAHMEKANAELATAQETFQQKSKKLDAIMRQVQGLNA